MSWLSLFLAVLPSSGSAIGLTDWLSLGGRKSTPQLGKPLPHDKTRVHFFAGDFGSKDLARRYCFHSERNTPEDLTRELPDAFIDIAHVEVVFGGHRDRLAEFLDVDDLDRFLRKIAQKNTVVMIAEPAFGGFPYALNDTSILSYLGDAVVDV